MATEPNPAPDHAADLQLVRDGLRGDPEALEALARRLATTPRMVAGAARRLGLRLAPEECADVAQDVVLAVWRKLDSYEGRASLESWVVRFAFLEVRNVIRRRDRNRTADLEHAEAVPDEKPETMGPDAYAVIRNAVDALPPPSGDVMHLRHHEQLTFAAIGQRLGIPENSAKTLYHRGLVKLRAALGGRDLEDFV